MMHIGSTAMVFWLLGAGCWHGGRPVVPQSAESAVADSPIFWNEGQGEARMACGGRWQSAGSILVGVCCGLFGY